jgi:hypothetical protein
MTIIKGRRPTIELVVDHVRDEATRLGMRVERIVGHRAPDGMCEFMAVLDTAKANVKTPEGGLP